MTFVIVIFLGMAAPDLLHGLQIVEMNVPPMVQTNAVRSVILDCEYEVKDSEKEGLVIKWFFNNQEDLVYQWIPPQRPQDLGILKGKVNLDYSVSSDVYKAHRAMQIIHPTTEMSGEYTCYVSSYEAEKTEKRNMTVFTAPSMMKLTSRKVSTSTRSVTCYANGVFPKPNVTLTLVRSGEHTKNNLEPRVKVESRNGTYNIQVHNTFHESPLPVDTIVECLLIIPGTNYSEKRTLLFHKDQYETLGKVLPSSMKTQELRAETFPFVGIPTGGAGGGVVGPRERIPEAAALFGMVGVLLAA